MSANLTGASARRKRSIFVGVLGQNEVGVDTRMPYTKKISLSAGNYFTTDGNFGYHVSATNVGNRPVFITKIGFAVNDKIMVNPRTIGESQKILHTAESTSQYFSIEEMKSAVSHLGGADVFLDQLCDQSELSPVLDRTDPSK